jgi:hypothetical protein
MWGLQPDGSFRNSADGSGNGAEDVYSTVMRDLSAVRSKFCQALEQFDRIEGASSSSSPPDEMNRRMFQLFQMDLLPGINAMIIESKQQRDRKLVRPVAMLHKALAWAFVVGLNLAIVLYIYLFAVGQSRDRQYAWFQTFIVWLVLEVFVVSTAMVYVTHFLIPSLVMRDLAKVKRRLMQTIQEYKQDLKGRSRGGALKADREPAAFNAAEYFFVSWRMSQVFPDLPASRVISRFNTPWPHQSYLRTRSVATSYSRRFSTVMRSGIMIATFFVRGFLSLPPGVQDMLVSIASVVVSGNFISYIVVWYAINPIIPILMVFAAGALLFLLVRLILAKGGARESDEVPTKRLVPAKADGAVSAASESYSSGGNAPSDAAAGGAELDGARAIKTRRQSIAEGVRLLQEMHSSAPGMGGFEGIAAENRPKSPSLKHVVIEINNNSESESDRGSSRESSTTSFTSYSSGSSFSWDASSTSDDSSDSYSSTDTSISGRGSSRRVGVKVSSARKATPTSLSETNESARSSGAGGSSDGSYHKSLSGDNNPKEAQSIEYLQQDTSALSPFSSDEWSNV